MLLHLLIAGVTGTLTLRADAATHPPIHSGPTYGRHRYDPITLHSIFYRHKV